MKQISRLPDAELEVMQALWAVPEYPARTSDLAARLEPDWKAPTLLKLPVPAGGAGLCPWGEKEGRSNGYTPLVNRPDLSGCGEPILPGAGPRRFPVQPGMLPCTQRRS